MFSYSLAEIASWPIGTIITDPDGDKWQKQFLGDRWVSFDGKYGFTLGDLAMYEDEYITEVNFPNVKVVTVAEEETIKKSDLIAFLKRKGWQKGYHNYDSLVSEFDLKVEPDQDMVITLRIPVENMNPLGDTYGDAVRLFSYHGIDLTDIEKNITGNITVTIEEVEK